MIFTFFSKIIPKKNTMSSERFERFLMGYSIAHNFYLDYPDRIEDFNLELAKKLAGECDFPDILEILEKYNPDTMTQFVGCTINRI